MDLSTPFVSVPASSHDAPFLPLDVGYEIIDELASFPTTDAFEYECRVPATLSSLCLVSRAVQRRATFHLYSCISVGGGYLSDQISCLLATGLPHRALTHTLVVATDADNDESAEEIVRLVSSLAPTLRRLMFSAEAGPVIGGPLDFSRAILDLPVIRDLAIIPCMNGYRYFVKDTDQHTLLGGLRRVLIDGVMLSYGIPATSAFLRRCPNLEVLAISWYAEFRHEIEEDSLKNNIAMMISSTIHTLPSLKHIVLFYAEPEAFMVQNFSNPYHDRVSIIDASVPVHRFDVTNWMGRNARNGRPWKLVGRMWPPPAPDA